MTAVESPDRGRQMEDRILATAARAGVVEAGGELLKKAYRTAMALRADPRRGIAARDPAYLHPGRTVLILVQDLGEADGRVLAAGALAESRDAALRVTRDTALAVLEGAALEGFEWWDALPPIDWRGSGDPPDEELLEDLVTASAPVQRIAMAEALDHVRHSHLLDGRGLRIRTATLVRDVFLPVAPRVHPVLDRRFAWWFRRVGSRWIGAASA